MAFSIDVLFVDDQAAFLQLSVDVCRQFQSSFQSLALQLSLLGVRFAEKVR